MKLYTINHKSGFRTAATALPRSEKHHLFSTCWQNKKYEEALNNFPDQWIWLYGEQKTEQVGDIIGTTFSGMVFSERAFSIITKLFPEEVKFNHRFTIDKTVLYWIHPHKIEYCDIKKTELNLFSSSPMSTKYASQKFVDVCIKNNLIGRDFVELK